jgi:hypothetical protein
MKQRGWPDRRGMGAQSDFISEQFVPDERQRAQQRVMAETLAPTSPERTTSGWRIPVTLRDRIASWARWAGRNSEDVASEWLEDRLLKEERKLAASLGKPIPKD